MHFAIIDEGGVLTGFRPAEENEIRTERDDVVEVPEDCDLEPGRYRWDGARFMPIILKAPASDEPEPHALRAIAKGFIAIRDQKANSDIWMVELPAETLEWLSFYERTIDSKG